MSASGESRVEVIVPEIGPKEVTLSVWFAEPGDRVFAGDRLVEVIVGGASFDVPAPVTGQLTERCAFPRDHVKPGQVVGAMTADPE